MPPQINGQKPFLGGEITPHVQKCDLKEIKGIEHMQKCELPQLRPIPALPLRLNATIGTCFRDLGVSALRSE